ncbi:intracellular sulfur oxidation DsrE/DsrF family protein [Algoriphagus ratkowskyi]|uniref:DsrE family protein n=1 Tax=Algoriphagus ratkowskyi TaxID=57028 RepID=A0A2W7TAI3_9BACT|nr:DsrE family protein [Algoriphagus ratkowskyi]PZX60182.1 intracellular sulfur oxidation DsrE/DsrF family protein [Algoriphagus ratkowskyi]TXD78007.1 DsrE family protein [Algoriphagus ratkowskyi]
MKRFFYSLAVMLLFNLSFTFAQDGMPPHIKDHITYPVLDFHPWVGVMPTENAALPFDPTLDYKIVLDLYGKMNDSTEIHPVFLEVARTYNLNIANGVPAEKIQIAAVIHGGIVKAILSEENYQTKYQATNPNLVAIKALEEVGVKFYVCNQSMRFNNIAADKITPFVKVAVSAKTAFVTLDQMGYSYLNVSED